MDTVKYVDRCEAATQSTRLPAIKSPSDNWPSKQREGSNDRNPGCLPGRAASLIKGKAAC